MSDYRKDSLEKYVQDLSARLPAPGGGSAAALVATLGASLVSMVVNFTLGKPRYVKYENELKEILSKSESLKVKLLELVDLDVDAYKSKNLRDSLNIPLVVARLSFEGIKLCPALVKKGNVNLISDVAVAAQLLESGFSAACVNIEINLKSLGDKKLTAVMRKELKAKDKTLKKIRLQTEERVGKIIRG
ncbi:MAG: cyclodeaminase/cyclohydrolase family protein [Candidatus Omnitrophota bacterium]